MKQYHSASVTV